MILIVASETDPNVSGVAKSLRAMGEEVAFLDHAAPSVLEFRMNNSGIDLLRLGDAEISDAALVWYRTKLSCDPFPRDEEAAIHYQRETSWRDAIQNLLLLLDRRVVNTLSSVKRAEFKLLQLKTATDVGFRIPPTLISNDYNSLCKWVGTQGDVVLKALGNPEIPDMSAESGSSTIMTTRISAELLANAEDSVRIAPSFLQAEVPKLFELRVVVHGEQMFAFRIDSQAQEFTKVDWRYGATLDCFDVIDLDPILRDGIADYMLKMDLFAGHFDFIRVPDGAYVFLECNPQGWFSWLDDLCGGDISTSIAEELVKRARMLQI